MKQSHYIIVGLLMVVVAGASFFAGSTYSKSQTNTGFMMNAAGRNGQAGGFPGGAQGASGANRRMTGGMRPVAGEILSADATSLTVKMPDGSSKIVILSGSTSISKQDKATQADLKAGEKVAVFGTANSDGSVTAQSVQLNPQTSMMRTGTPSAQPTK